MILPALCGHAEFVASTQRSGSVSIACSTPIQALSQRPLDPPPAGSEGVPSVLRWLGGAGDTVPLNRDAFKVAGGWTTVMLGHR